MSQDGGSRLIDLVPFTYTTAGRPKELVRKAAVERHEALITVLPERLAYIREVLALDGVQECASHQTYLSEVGEWLASRAELEDISRFLSDQERARGPKIDISIPTVSACHYIGYLFGDLLLKECPELSYSLCVDSKRNVYYHESIIISRDGGNELSPTVIVMNFTRGRLDPECRALDLGDLYNIWEKILRTGFMLT